MLNSTFNFSFNSPTPTHAITTALTDKSTVSVYMKRDDLIHPFISGNKWRKLKYIFENMLRNDQHTVVTFGGAWSNHLLATACAGAIFKIRTIGFVRGEEQVSNPVLNLCKLYGMELNYVDRSAYRDKKALFDSWKLSNLNAKAVFVDEGGAHPLALIGCEEIIEEIKATGQEFDHIFCACGTGTTLAGLAKGIAEHEIKTRLHGVPVLAGGDFIGDTVRELYPDGLFELHTAYHFGGYAKTKPELLDFIRDFVSKSGILIEPVYTGKLMYAVNQLIEQNFFAENDKILVLHTGGMTGILGMHELF